MVVGVESLTAQIKQLQNAIQSRQWEDAANVLRLLKKVDATEELLRATKAGVAVGKIRSCENAPVSQLSKEVVTKWKSQVEEIKKKRGGGSTTSTAAASPAAGSTPAGGASPSPANGASQKTSVKVNTSAAKISTANTASPSSSTPTPSVSTGSYRRDSIDAKSPTGPMDPRSIKSDGIKLPSVGDKVRDKCLEMAYDAIVFDSPAPSELILTRAQAIEKNCYSEFGSTNGDYRNKMRRLILNLKDKNNPSLRQAVVSGDIPVDRFCKMSNAEMASDELKKATDLLNQQNLHHALAAGEQEAETDAFQCGRCKQRKTRYRQAQTRSADEPMTTFVTQSDGEDADVEQTQATDGSAYSDVASSQTFQVIEGPPAVGGTDFAADVEGGLQNPNSNRAVAGQLNIAGNAEACPVTVTQLYDDEEWASNLSGEDIEAAFETPTRWRLSVRRQESESETPTKVLPPAGGLLYGSSPLSASRSSSKRPSSKPDNQDGSPRLAKRLKVIPQSPEPEEQQDFNAYRPAYPYGINIVADPEYFDNSNVAWGIKWEFTRLANQRPVTVSKALLSELRGTHVSVASKLHQVIEDHSANRGGSTAAKAPSQQGPQNSRESAVTAPWEELDREDKAWKKGTDEGIGLKAKDGWYGGKVQFSTTLDWDEKKKFKMHLNAPTTGKSSHFGRAFHSRSCITVRISRDALRQPTLKRYLKSCHRFFGRDFYVLDASTDKVTLVDANARRPGHDPLTERPDEAVGIQWMINYLNPMELNQNQSVSKWRARFQLYFSDTVPGSRIHPGRVLREMDLELPHDGDKCPSEKVLTAGCGRISSDTLKTIQENLKLERPISAVQLRFLGAKGMALAMLPPPYEPEEPADIPNQNPNGPRYTTDEAKLTIDIVRPARISTPARLSAESIQILSHNGVSTSVFLDLQKNCFEEDFSALVDWPEDKPLVKLAHAITQIQNVVGERRTRLVRGMARARGLSAKSWDEVEEGQELLEPEAEPRSAAWWPDDVSGCPSTLAETCLVNLQAGFRPESLPYLKRKLKHLLDDSLARYVDKFKITIPHALTGTLVPDPLGVLEPDEISISLSEPMDIDGKKVMVLQGPCLILRNPAKQETDVRKVNIVTHPQLHQLKDVIVVSVKNKDRSLASRLGGGDYDGDKAQVILEDALVKPFRNAPTDNALEVPESVKNSFKAEDGSVAGLLVEKQRDFAHFAWRLSNILLLPLNIYPGEYSIFHELAVYMHGMGHPEAIRLGYMFTEGLDGCKTGKSVNEETQRADAETYRRFGRVNWNRGREYVKKPEFNGECNNLAKHQIPRDKRLGPFVMDKLREAGGDLHREILKRFDDRIERDTKWRPAQTDVVRKWASACRVQLKQREPDITQNEAIATLRRLIEDIDVDSSFVTRDIRPLDHWMQAISRVITWVVKRGNGSYAADLDRIYSAIVPIAREHYVLTGRKFTSLDIVTRHNALRRLSVEFAEAVPLDDLLTPMSPVELALLKASCAYSLSYRRVQVTGQFAFSVATRDLCYLKALDRPYQATSQEFIDGMHLHSGYVGDFE
ncbi:hypothetical protein FRC04_001621 [Tulasnella sp. 424]|nr:hypothetical protein FRC04_001621 [Tulasnella sp. 424]KAG8968648.1 hypothetical protein FRC05_001454 [Tulasnella sp. 425]